MLVVIPARGGSKGLPRKNINHFAGKPLICHSIDVARELISDLDICVSTDDCEIKGIVESYGLKVPFIRPVELASDTASTNDVLLHAVNYYQNIGKYYDFILLLQPTSPLRTAKQVLEAIDLYNDNLDMVVSVRLSHAASVLCNENEAGYLELAINKNGDRRQNFAQYYEYDGSIYVINVKALMEVGLSGMIKKKKYIMPNESSIDIDNILDWRIAEFLFKKQNNE